MARDAKMTRHRSDFSELPEECLSYIIALATPRDACRLGAVSSAFKSAANSDYVWSRLLPPDIDAVLSRASGTAASSSTPPGSSSLKQLYLRLCHSPVLLDGGQMSFSLNRSNGKKSYMLSARALSIAWADTPRYWRWSSVSESRFLEVAELISVWWFEIRGRIDVHMLSFSTLYAAYLVFKSTLDSYGFMDQAIQARVGLVDGEAKERTVYLDSAGRTRSGTTCQGLPRRTRRHVMLPMLVELAYQNRDLQSQEDPSGEGRSQYPEERADGWLEIELGEFFRGIGDDGEILEACVSEVKRLDWKSGLIIQGIEIRPKIISYIRKGHA